MTRLNAIRWLLLCAAVAFLAPACSKKSKGKKGPPSKVTNPNDDQEGKTPEDVCLRLHDDEEEHEHDDEEHDEELDADIEEDDLADVSTSGCPPQDSEPVETEDGSSGNAGGWDAGPGLEGCQDQGKAWIAVKNGGAGVCGDPLVTWCCSEAEVYNQFPDLADALKKDYFDKYKADGLKLYHCSESGDKTMFHWATNTAQGPKYGVAYVQGSKAKGGTADASCPRLTSEDLGFNAGNTGGTGDPQVGGEQPSDVPASIGTITDTSMKGILAWLRKTPSPYAAWTNSGKVADSAQHKKVKTFFNGKLKASLEDFDESHTKGSIVVKELYKTDGKTLDGYAMMAKANSGSGADTWFFYQITGAPDFKEPPSAYGMGVKNCADCHGNGGKDYIKSKLP